MSGGRGNHQFHQRRIVQKTVGDNAFGQMNVRHGGAARCTVPASFPTDTTEDFLMARKLVAASPSRRDFLKTAGLLGGMAAAGWPAPGHAQGLRTITASHSVSTVVYGQHLVAAQKKFFEEEGLKTPD